MFYKAQVICSWGQVSIREAVIRMQKRREKFSAKIKFCLVMLSPNKLSAVRRLIYMNQVLSFWKSNFFNYSFFILRIRCYNWVWIRLMASKNCVLYPFLTSRDYYIFFWYSCFRRRPANWQKSILNYVPHPACRKRSIFQKVRAQKETFKMTLTLHINCYFILSLYIPRGQSVFLSGYLLRSFACKN